MLQITARILFTLAVSIAIHGSLAVSASSVLCPSGMYLNKLSFLCDTCPPECLASYTYAPPRRSDADLQLMCRQVASECAPEGQALTSLTGTTTKSSTGRLEMNEDFQAKKLQVPTWLAYVGVGAAILLAIIGLGGVAILLKFRYNRLIKKADSLDKNSHEAKQPFNSGRGDGSLEMECCASRVQGTSLPQVPFMETRDEC